MHKKIVFGFLIFLSTQLIWSQNDPVLLSIGDETYAKSEFERLFSKNKNVLQSEEAEDTDKNIALFIDYILKIKEAEAQGLDTLPGFKQQYSSFQKELSTKYIFETEVTEKIVKQAYDRLKWQKNVDYILVQVDQNASPQDTLKAYQKAMEFKKSVDKGADFNAMALRFSEDPSARENKGKLGWMTAFSTVYDFENAVYNAKIGEVSEPFRSEFGYHVIRVNEERPRDGEISVAHILIRKDQSDEKKAEEKIRNIYKKITEDNIAFEDLARQYSEDKATAKEGGKMRRFSRGSLSDTEFEDVAFGLNEKNPLSKPFETASGWHLIKFVDFHPIGSFEAEKNRLSQAIIRNNRSLVIRDSLLKDLKQKYTLKESEPGVKYFIDKIGKNYRESTKKDLPEGNMFELKDMKLSYLDFFRRIERMKIMNPRLAITPEFLSNLYNEQVNAQYIEQARKDLEVENPTYAAELKDYRNGLLIYDLIEKNIFKKSDDSIALRQFYEKNKSDFNSPEKYEMIVVSGSNKKEVSKAAKYLKKGKSQEAIKNTFPDLILHREIYTADHPQLPSNFKKSKGISKVHRENGFYLVSQTLQVIPAKQESFENIKGRVVTQYQAQIEKDFITELRKKYDVKLNESTLESLKN